MPTLLHIDSSPLYGRSVTRELTHELVSKWRENHASDNVIVRDLTANPPTPVTAEWVGAAYTPAESRSPGQRDMLAPSDKLLAELETADEYVIGVPMHNFGVPSVLKLWIDQICRVNRTFAYEDGKPKGLLLGKRATFLIASGGIYDPGTQMASFNFVEPYLKSVFGFLGVKDTKFLTAGGTKALNQGENRASFLAPYIEAVQTHARSLEGERL